MRIKTPDNKENVIFEFYLNLVEIVNISVAQKKLCDYLATRRCWWERYPQLPTWRVSRDSKDDCKRSMRKLTTDMRNPMEAFLLSCDRGTANYKRTGNTENVIALWIEIIRLVLRWMLILISVSEICISRYHSESVRYDRDMQEVNAWSEPGNVSVDTELIMQWDDTEVDINEDNARVRAIRSSIFVNSEIDRNGFSCLTDDLVNEANNYSNNMVKQYSFHWCVNSMEGSWWDTVSNIKDMEGSQHRRVLVKTKLTSEKERIYLNI